MLKVFVIEDERPAMDHLVKSLKQVDETINIVSTAASVKESIEWLSSHPAPDLIFMDFNNDGLSFNIFRHCKITSPVIFVTAYDQYTMDAFLIMVSTIF
jgi:DNA-binding LytR/AlgR family response regulator